MTAIPPGYTARAPFWAKFWGVRGTVPVPGETTLRYGGNTSCVELRCGDERIILDLGTGVRALGHSWLAEGGPCRAHVLISHTHVDHINGFAFFKPAYMQGTRLGIWNGHLAKQGRRLNEVLANLMQSPFFPVPLDIMHARIDFHDVDAGDLLDLAPGIVVRTHALEHPGGATGYRIEFDGRSLCYVTDTEHKLGRIDEGIAAFVSGADLVIYDSTYTDEEFPRFEGWGHSTWQEGVRLCNAAGAKRLVAFHHEPCHADSFLDRVASELDAAHPGSVVASEGLVLEP